MNVTLNNLDPVNATVKIEVLKDDYEGLVNKSLKKIRDTTPMHGFRPGHVPLARVRQMYGRAVMIDEINKLVSTELYDYIRQNELNVLGEPLPSRIEQDPLDFDNQLDYTFQFDLGLAPKMDVVLTKEDKIRYFDIQVPEEMIDGQMNNFKASYGSYEQVEKVEGKDMVRGLLTELDEEGKPKEDGIEIEEAVLMPYYIKDEEEKAKFTDAALHSVIVFNPHKAYEGNGAELASFLKITKEEVDGHTGDFSIEINEITRYKEAELGEALYDKVFEPGTVKTEEEFRNKIREVLFSQTIPESDFRFLLDVRKVLLEKSEGICFPDDFLKRWLLESKPEERTAESVEEEYPKILEDLKFHLIREQLLKEHNVKVEKEDIEEYAKRSTRAQFAQYGMTNIPESMVESYAQDMMKKEETVRNLVDKILEDRLITILKGEVTLEMEPISTTEFEKMFAAPAGAEEADEEEEGENSPQE